jgi:hypothetical protein
MPTTAGTHLLRNNTAADAFIITQIKDRRYHFRENKPKRMG